MAGFITALTGENGITAASIWAEITPIVPFVVTLIGVKLGYHVVASSVNQVTRPEKKRVIKG